MVVTSIIRQNKKMSKVYIDDNYCFSADNEDIKKYCIEEGRILNNSELKELIYSCQYNKAYNKVLKLLSIRSRTEFELREKLAKQNYDKIIIDQVIARMKELNYVNDVEFAKMWVENRKRMKPTGRKKLMAELNSLGIEYKLASEVVDNCNLDDLETAIEILNKKPKVKEYKINNKNEYSKIIRYLMYRGIDYNTAAKAIKQLFSINCHDCID